MKMGNILSPWRYDVIADDTLPLASLGCTAIQHRATRIPILLGGSRLTPACFRCRFAFCPLSIVLSSRKALISDRSMALSITDKQSWFFACSQARRRALLDLWSCLLSSIASWTRAINGSIIVIVQRQCRKYQRVPIAQVNPSPPGWGTVAASCAPRRYPGRGFL